MSIEEKINLYLNDHERLFQEWYLKQIQHETGIDDVEPVTSFNEYRKSFNNWVENNKTKLQKKICPNLNKIKGINKPVEIVLVIIILIEGLTIVGGVTQDATALFVYGIERLCK